MNKHEVIRDMYPSVGTISISAEGVIKARDTNGNVVVLDESKIDAEVIRLQVEYDAKQYQRDRNYPDIGEQLDMLYWDKKNDTKNWEDAIDKVKADNPKPE